MSESYYTCATCGGRVLEHSLCPRCESTPAGRRMTATPAAGQRWLVRDRLPLSRRVATIDAVADGEVVHRFVDSGTPSRCSLTAFQRTYVPEEAA